MGMEEKAAWIEEGMVVRSDTQNYLPGAVETAVMVTSFVIVWSTVLVVPGYICQPIDDLYMLMAATHQAVLPQTSM